MDLSIKGIFGICDDDESVAGAEPVSRTTPRRAGSNFIGLHTHAHSFSSHALFTHFFSSHTLLLFEFPLSFSLLPHLLAFGLFLLLNPPSRYLRAKPASPAGASSLVPPGPRASFSPNLLSPSPHHLASSLPQGRPAARPRRGHRRRPPVPSYSKMRRLVQSWCPFSPWVTLKGHSPFCIILFTSLGT